MGIAIALILILIAVLLFVATRKGWIADKTLERSANIATIVALLAAAVTFIFLCRSSPAENTLLTPSITNTANNPTAPPALIASATVAFHTQTPLPATTIALAASPVPVMEYGLPRSGGMYLVYDTSLRVVYSDQLIKLELVEAEHRFKAAESIPWEGSAVAWDGGKGISCSH